VETKLVQTLELACLNLNHQFQSYQQSQFLLHDRTTCPSDPMAQIIANLQSVIHDMASSYIPNNAMAMPKIRYGAVPNLVISHPCCCSAVLKNLESYILRSSTNNSVIIIIIYAFSYKHHEYVEIQGTEGEPAMSPFLSDSKKKCSVALPRPNAERNKRPSKHKRRHTSKIQPKRHRTLPCPVLPRATSLYLVALRH